MVFYFVAFFVFLGGASEIAVLPAWELNSGEKKKGSTLVTSKAPSPKKTGFCQSRFSCFSSFLVPFGRPFGFLLASFWSLRCLFGVPVSSFWFSLACLSRLWALSATFCGAFGSPGLSLGSGAAP